MAQSESVQEEVITTQSAKRVEPQAKGEPPQKVYETKKTIIRFNQVIWYILGLIEILLIFRIVLKALGANPFTGFTNLIFTLTAPLAVPFNGILGATVVGNSVIEWSTIVAGIVYLCVAWGLVYLINLIYPISPKDVNSE